MFPLSPTPTKVLFPNSTPAIKFAVGEVALSQVDPLSVDLTMFPETPTATNKLEIEEDEDSESRGIGLRFTKLHVPMEVMKRYAEILKIRMKLKVGNQSYPVASKKGQDCGLHRPITGGG